MINQEFVKRFLSSIIIIPLALFFIIFDAVFFLFFLLILFLISSYEWTQMNKRKKINIVIGNIFLFLSFYSANELRNYDTFYLFLFLLTIVIFTDIGGYIFGKLLKGPKITKISPNKTYAGLFGGIILSLISGTIYFNHFSHELNIITSMNIFKISINDELGFFLLIILISTISQIGDFIISYFKRLSKLKDTGQILPGHGGLLDRIDGLIFATPIFYLLIIIN